VRCYSDKRPFFVDLEHGHAFCAADPVTGGGGGVSDLAQHVTQQLVAHLLKASVN
jgi:hypothetical protein